MLLCESEKTLEIILEGELCHWICFWQEEKNKISNIPETVLEVLDVCDSDILPTIRSLLHVLATLPVSIASAERSFSTLRRTKTWIRSRMAEDRLNGLCLLHIHKDVPVDIDKVLERFAKKGNRRLELLI